MKTKQLETASSMAHAAGLLGLDVEVLRDAKGAGCPAFLPAGRVRLEPLRSWIRRHRGKARLPSKAPPELVRGMAASLRRLEEAEAAAFQRMTAAVGTGAEAGCRKAWLAVAEGLRRADIALEAARRDGGELIPRQTAETALEAAMGCVAIGMRGVGTRLSPYVTKQENRVEFMDTMDAAFANLVHVSAGMATGSTELPPWAVSALHRGSGRGLALGPEDEWSKLGDVVRGVVGGVADKIIAGSKITREASR